MSDRSFRRGLLAFVTIASGAACASPAVTPAADGPVVAVPKVELAQLRSDAARATALADQLAALEKTHAATLVALHTAEQRLGIAPFDTTALERADFSLKLPDASRVDAQGAKAKKMSLGKALAETERGLIVAYWATWCKPCTSDEELARLARLRTELARHGAGLVFLAVDGLDKVNADPRAPRWLYPLWQRDQAHLEMLPEAFVRNHGVDLPLFLAVGKSGRVAFTRKEALDDDAMRDFVTAVIRGL